MCPEQEHNPASVPDFGCVLNEQSLSLFKRNRRKVPLGHDGGDRPSEYMGRRNRTDQVGSRKGRRPLGVGDSALLRPKLRRSFVTVDGARELARLAHMLVQQRPHSLEVPRERLDDEDRAPVARSRTSFCQV